MVSLLLFVCVFLCECSFLHCIKNESCFKMWKYLKTEFDRIRCVQIVDMYDNSQNSNYAYVYTALENEETTAFFSAEVITKLGSSTKY